MKAKNLFSIFLSLLLIVMNTSILSSAESHVNPDNNFAGNNESIQPFYDIIHSITLDIVEEGVDAIIETDWPASLQITITLYQQKGSGWSFLAKKTFSENGTYLSGRLNYNYQSGVTYKAVANFRAGSETDSMEDIFSF